MRFSRWRARDALEDGRPSDNTRRRWQRFGQSGAKLIWGGEAVAVRPDGRANPNQLTLNEHTQRDIGEMRGALVAAHREVMGSDQGLVIGLQLTHSGRFCKPNDHHRQEPMILYRHPILDRKFNSGERIGDDVRCGVGDTRELCRRGRGHKLPRAVQPVVFNPAVAGGEFDREVCAAVHRGFYAVKDAAIIRPSKESPRAGGEPTRCG